MKTLFVVLVASVLAACGGYECDVYLGDNNHPSYTNESYPGDTEEEAEENCEDDYEDAHCSCDEADDDDD